MLHPTENGAVMPT